MVRILLTALMLLRSLSKMLTLLFADTRSWGQTMQFDYIWISLWKGSIIYWEWPLQMQLTTRLTDFLLPPFSSLPFSPFFSPAAQSTWYWFQKYRLERKLREWNHLILVYHFLFRKIQLKTFLAAALAAACSLERMMLFCQMEPKLFMKLHIFLYKSITYIYI